MWYRVTFASKKYRPKTPRNWTSKSTLQPSFTTADTVSALAPNFEKCIQTTWMLHPKCTLKEWSFSPDRVSTCTENALVPHIGLASVSLEYWWRCPLEKQWCYCDAVSQFGMIYWSLVNFCSQSWCNYANQSTVQTLRCCFEHYELVRTRVRALWHEDIAPDEWSVMSNFLASLPASQLWSTLKTLAM